MSGVSTTAASRLRKDYVRLMRDPVPFVTAAPNPSNILEWHYVIEGPPDSTYSGGYYHGKLVFPPDYPFKPPAIYMLTPNGRFQINTRLCLSISDYHPDTWNPAWSVATILTGLLSFMLETTSTLGSIEASDYERRRLARQSWDYNLKNKMFRDLFVEIVERLKSKIDDEKRQIEQNGRRNGTDLTSVTGGDVDGIQQNGQNHLNNSTLSNVLVFVGLVAFAFVARYVFQMASLDPSN
jgi:ubiquitin-conjugating enzyme E2 J2